MRVLWITNIIFPDVCREIKIKEPVIGGWMYASAKSLVEECEQITLSVATVYKGKEIQRFFLKGIYYYLIPLTHSNKKYNSSLESHWKDIVSDFRPNIAHIHGTEFGHSLAFLNACPQIPSVVSIQGLLSVYERYYLAGLTLKEIISNITLRDIAKYDTIYLQQKKMRKRGELEKQIIRKTNNVIGRTEWDEAHSVYLNPKVNYHFCNETLRAAFYDRKWNYDSCDAYSIFISQAGYPIKGFHQVLKIIKSVIDIFPKTKIYVSGQNIINTVGIKNKIFIYGYGLYIKKIIKKYGIEKNIIFMGPLKEEAMVKRYLKSNIFICPSSIENSPNSLGEAQILGVPVIASYAGGIPDMVEHGVTGFLYRFEEIEMLKKNILKIFSMNKEELMTLSSNEREVARYRHDSNKNTKKMVNIYEEIIKDHDHSNFS